MTKEEEKLFDQMSLLSNGDDEEGLLFFIDTHKDLLKADPIKFIGLHVSFYANKEDVNKSLQTVEYYKSAPYISMEVEDFLNELKVELKKINEPKKEYGDEEIRKFLFSKNENAIVSALHVLSKKNIRNYLPLVKDFLKSEQLYKYKTLALFVLIEQKVNEEIVLIKDGMEYSINPSLMYLPFDQFDYLDTKDALEKKDENLEVIQNAIEILNTVQIKNYPDTILDLDEVDFISDIFIEVSKSFLGNDANTNKIATKYQVEESKVIGLMKEITQIFNS